MTGDAPDFSQRLAERAAQVETVLEGILDPHPQKGEIARPAHLLAAMRHGVLNGGKRLRPFLVLETAELTGADSEAALRVAAALECVHCYSLIHDDLPAMDNDDLRRGLPTVHVAFDDATAILAGDTLLTIAFEIITAPQTPADDSRKTALVLSLARAAGIGGMAGGQALDLAAETTTPDEAGIITLQAMKTGALLRFACEAGAILGETSEEDRECLIRFGEAIGLAFQLADDLLDVTSDSDHMGKATGKDAERGKATLVGLHGQPWARRQLSGLVEEANALLDRFGDRALILRIAARFIAERDR
ncbi:polyprenyl synthetase family protein [Hoeflea poritis]|uniref:Polyprenyl synthetase family protein n=1 Tax=Hoeflea poritis TaxID=2993659 RepID=A0ABT4VLR3_9HYPH|nr:farnesyl diphosphate synthase [Hoeflea poritis]MDA4845657.1 polyprenyl synthetase family protein [Hoeflea poritis]